MKKAEEKGLETYPVIMNTLLPAHDDLPETKVDCNLFTRKAYVDGYEQAEKDLLQELKQLSFSSNPMDYVKWVDAKIKELENN